MFVLTHSSIQTFKNCRRAWYARNVLKLVRTKKKQSRQLGSAFHRGLQTRDVAAALKLYDGVYPADQAEADIIEIDKATVAAMLNGYFLRWPDEPLDGVPCVRREIKFEVPIVNPQTGALSRSFRFAGKVDGVKTTPRGLFLVEDKTAGKLERSYIDRLPLDHQVTAYIHGLQRHYHHTQITGVSYRIIRKPSIRPRQNESVQQFCDRLTRDYRERPDFYFVDEGLFRAESDLKEFEAELWQVTQDILTCRRRGLWYRNTSRCSEYGGCEYLLLCLGQDPEGLYVREEPNSELKEEDDNGDTGDA